MLKNALNEIKTDWKDLLLLSLEKFDTIDKLLTEEKKNFGGLQEIYPKEINIFKCFNFFNRDNLKVVILGQDPYHQPDQAQGLSFSVPENIRIPPSLVNIFKEIKHNYPNYEIPKSGNLDYLAKQGILLLNNSLTVRQSSPNSHLKIWKGYSNFIIENILRDQENIIFLLWGGNAKKIFSKVSEELKSKHIILEANHPSPLSANRGGWFGCEHFRKVNDHLNALGKSEIKW
jgi:uracil-DNA glycosylase